MTPDDPRHGTLAGHVAGCRGFCCRIAKNQYEAIRTRDHMLRRPRQVPAVGVHRRIRALMALGWTSQHIADAAGWTRREYVCGLLRRELVRVATAERVRTVYDELSMTLGPSDETRKRATRQGWPKPLAWDDDTIDDPDAKPYRPPTKTPLGGNPELRDVDHVIVERAMRGERVHANPAEKLEVIRRWTDVGRSLNELDRLQGWNTRRELNREQAA